MTTSKHALSMLLFLFCAAKPIHAQDIQELYQGFEGTAGDSWNFAPSPARYVADDGDDVWADTTATGAIQPATGQKFWFMRDLDNSNGGNNSFHVLDFEPVDISGFVATVVSFKYYTIDYDNNDSIGYILETEPGAGFDMANYIGLSRNTGEWKAVHINLPAGATAVRLRLMAKQDGSTDYAGFDDISIFSSTEDVIPPLVTDAELTGANTVRLAYSEPMNPASVKNPLNYTANATIRSITYTEPTDGFPYVDITFTNNFAAGQAYSLSVGLVADQAGNFLLLPFTFDFIYNNTAPSLIITEIFYNPRSEEDLEFIEIYNAGGGTAILGGLQASGEFNFTFPAGLSLGAGQVLLLAYDEALAESFFGQDFTGWGATNNLGNGGGDIIITNFSGAVIDEVNYDDNDPWPEGADGDGPSLELIATTLDNNNGISWRTSSTQVGNTDVFATPGIIIENPPPIIAFQHAVVVVEEGAGSQTLALAITYPNTLEARAVLSVASASTALAGIDYILESDTLTFLPANSEPQLIHLDFLDNVSLGGRYLIIEIAGLVNGEAGANDRAIVLIRDTDAIPPTAGEGSAAQLSHLGSYALPEGASAGTIAYDAGSSRIFVANPVENKLEILDFSNPSGIEAVASIALDALGGGIRAVAARNGLVALAVQGNSNADPGRVVFLDTNGALISSVTVGILPGMLLFSPDGTKVLTADEGAPSGDYAIDPEGSVSIVDISGGATNPLVTTLDFTAFNSQQASLAAQGVRIFGPGATVAQDMEPEHIAISDDGSTAYVVCQENNALALVDLAVPEITAILPLGYKDWSAEGVTLDASNLSGDIFFANWPVKGLYQPGAINYFTVGGQAYLITANEGEARAYDTFSEEFRVGDDEIVLDPDAFPDAAYLKEDVLLGSLRISSASGDTDGDGDYDELYTFGARSFAIWNAAAGTLVYDSGNSLEQITAADPVYGALFNSDDEENEFKGRSDDKGPEPGAVAVARINGVPYAFIGMEQVGGLVMYNLANPEAPKFAQYINTRAVGSHGGDLSPEDVIFIAADDSPTGRAYVLVSYKISGTVAVFEVATAPTVSFAEAHSVAEEGSGEWQVALIVEQSGRLSGEATVKVISASSAVEWEDFSIASTTAGFEAGSSEPQSIKIDIRDNDAPGGRYLILEIDAANSTVQAGENSRHILLIQDNDDAAPAAQPDPYLQMEYLGSYATAFGASLEAVGYDEESRRLFVSNPGAAIVEILDYSDPADISLVDTFSILQYGAGTSSVAVRDGIVAVAVPAYNTGDNGKVAFFGTDGNFRKEVTVGAQPKMVLFSPDGTKVLTANEGAPNGDYTIDPEGSISIIDISGGLENASVNTLGFQGFNGQQASLVAQGVRIFGPNATVAQDLEPEHIAISGDGSTAYVACQENNALAVISLASETVAAILPLGAKDWAQAGRTFDASDRAGDIFFANWPVKGLYQPDAIGYFSVGGAGYLITANEGEARSYDAFSEEFRVSDDAIQLDPDAFPDAAYLKEGVLLGRLHISSASGDIDGDGDYDELYAFGARSFAIWDAATGALVYDSGNSLEQITAADPVYGTLFNSESEANEFKGRSDDKGPEPEALAIAEIDGRQFAFIALERIGGIIAYEVSNPEAPEFIQYINTRTLDDVGGGLSPEGLVFIPASASPTGQPLLSVAYEGSGTLGLIELKLDCPITSLPDEVSFCEGEISLLQVSGIYEEVVWSTGEMGASIVASETGVYTAIATTSGGCVAMDTVNVSINPLPLINLPPDTLICAEGITLLGPGAGNAFIVNGKTLEVFIVDGYEPGAYSVAAEVVNEFGCRVPAEINFTVDICVGTESPEQAASVEVFPNPASRLATVHLRNLQEQAYELYIFSAGGQLVQQRHIRPVRGHHLEEVGLEAVPAGVYVLKLVSGKGIQVARLVVE